jgi:hypothetical protein
MAGKEEMFIKKWIGIGVNGERACFFCDMP